MFVIIAKLSLMNIIIFADIILNSLQCKLHIKKIHRL